MFGRTNINVEGDVVSTRKQYVDIEHPLTCSGYITAWHMCFYTDNIVSSDNYRVYLRVYRNRNPNQLEQVHQVVKDIPLSSQEVGSNSFVCMSDLLNEEDYLNVSAGDYLATYIPTVSRPLQIVGNNVLKSFLYRDTRDFLTSFTSTRVRLSDLEVMNGGFLHLHADIGKCSGTHKYSVQTINEFSNFSVSYLGQAPQVNPLPTSSMSHLLTTIGIPAPTPNGTQNDINDRELENDFSVNEDIANGTDSDGDNDSVPPLQIAAIASVTAIFILLVVLVITVALGIVVYRRWKVEQIKKGLLEIYPAHLAIGTIYKLNPLIKNPLNDDTDIPINTMFEIKTLS